MTYNKNNFWTNTQGVFPIIAEGSFNDLIVLAVNQSCTKPGFEINFNKSGDTLYIRTDNYAIRISNRWGEVGSCNWQLNRDADTEKFQMIKINYSELKNYQNE